MEVKGAAVCLCVEMYVEGEQEEWTGRGSQSVGGVLCLCVEVCYKLAIHPVNVTTGCQLSVGSCNTVALVTHSFVATLSINCLKR